jgi:hypothetical protein
VWQAVLSLVLMNPKKGGKGGKKVWRVALRWPHLALLNPVCRQAHASPACARAA